VNIDTYAYIYYQYVVLNTCIFIIIKFLHLKPVYSRTLVHQDVAIYYLSAVNSCYYT